MLALRKELDRIVIDDATNQRLAMSATAKFEDQVGNGGRLAGPPIAGRIDEQSLAAKSLDHVGGSLGRALRDRIERHSRPEATVQDLRDGVLFDVIDQDTRRIDVGVIAQHVQNHASSLVLVFQVWRVNQEFADHA